MPTNNLLDRGLSVLYLLILGAIIGAVGLAGMAAAPVIFHAGNYLPEATLSLLDSGRLMTEIFVRLNALVVAGIVLIVLHEAYRLFMQNRSSGIVYALSAVVVVCGALFVWYYTPYVVEAQQSGLEGVTTEKFDQMHRQSEMVFKVMFVAVIALFSLKAWQLTRKES